ncbi:MAG: family 20 glycosylhydrolase [Akkermansiaceae bacterium]|nr:family 20 glycosylhydrolase [Akkermansiaceae bacterium]
MNANHKPVTRRGGPRSPAPLAAFLLTLLTGLPLAAAVERPALVPWPVEYSPGAGNCVIDNGRRIVYEDQSLAPLAAILAKEVRMATGATLRAEPGRPAANEIALKLEGNLARESYELSVTATGIAVAGQNYNAVAMGTATLLQSMGRNAKGEVVVPAGVVRDACSAEYNGVMLDIARQEHSLEVLRDVIDLCRFYKIRYFRLHFSDDGACLFPFAAYPQTSDPARTWKLDEIKDLVRYADERGVTLVPELETPGHCTYLCHRLPEAFGKGPGMDPTMPRMYEVLDVMIGEIAAVFQSSPYIHIGCDEARVHTDDAQFLKDHGLKDDSDLFAWHVSRMNAIVKKHGKRTMAWECPSTDQDVISTVWNITSKPGEDRHGETANTLKAGRPVVQVTWEPSIGDPVEVLYDWRPYGKQQQFARDGMLGSEMVFWQNHGNIALRVLRFKVPVRNEVTYNPKVPDSYPQFVKRYARSQDQFDRVTTGMEMRIGGNVQSLEDWMIAGGKGFIGPVYEYTGALQAELVSNVKDATIRYLLEDKESWEIPHANAPIYDPAVLSHAKPGIGSTTLFKARLFDQDGQPLGRTLIREFHNNPFTVNVVGAVRKEDPRFAHALAFDLVKHLKTGAVRYQINGPVTTNSPEFTQPFRITDDATVTFQYFDEAGEAKGVPWRMLARKADFDPFSLTYKKPVTATESAKEFVELTVDGLVDRNECLSGGNARQAVTVDLGKALEVNRITLHTFWNPDDNRAYQYVLELSTDNQAWTTVADAGGNAVAAAATGYSHVFAPRKARYLRATVLGNNRTKGVEITELRAYGPDQKTGVPTTPSTQEILNPGLQADLQFIAQAVPANLMPTEISGSWDLIAKVFGPDFNCKLVGDTDFNWQCGEAPGVLDLNGHTLNWSTGGGNGTALDTIFIGNGGRINWDGGYAGNWVTYPSNLRGNKPNTFKGVFHLRHGTMVLRKVPGVSALSGDVEMGGADGWNESFLLWEQSDQLADTSSITTLPLNKDVKNPRATLCLQGCSETLGSLTVKTETIIDLGAKKDQKGTISFAGSSAKEWDLTKTLTIKGEGTVRFGTSAAGLSPAQLAIVGFATPQGLVKAQINADGTLAPR